MGYGLKSDFMNDRKKDLVFYSTSVIAVVIMVFAWAFEMRKHIPERILPDPCVIKIDLSNQHLKNATFEMTYLVISGDCVEVSNCYFERSRIKISTSSLFTISGCTFNNPPPPAIMLSSTVD